MNSGRSKSLNFNYLRPTALGCKDIVIRKFVFDGKNSISLSYSGFIVIKLTHAICEKYTHFFFFNFSLSLLFPFSFHFPCVSECYPWPRSPPPTYYLQDMGYFEYCERNMCCYGPVYTVCPGQAPVSSCHLCLSCLLTNF